MQGDSSYSASQRAWQLISVRGSNQRGRFAHTAERCADRFQLVLPGVDVDFILEHVDRARRLSEDGNGPGAQVALCSLGESEEGSSVCDAGLLGLQQLSSQLVDSRSR